MVTVTYHPVCGSTYRWVTWVTWCGKVCAAGCAWCLRGAMLLRGFRLFGVALHREPKGTKRVLIEGHPTWSGRAKHSYGHLLFIDLDEGVHEIQRLQITTPQVIPHGVRCEGLLRVLSWVSFDLPEHLKTTLSDLLVAAGEGNTELQNIPIGGRDIRDGQPETEADLQAVLIAMIPTPGGSHDEGG